VKTFENIMTFVSASYIIVIILPFFLIFSFIIGAWVISKFIDSDFKLELNSKLINKIKSILLVVASTVLGAFIIIIVLHTASQLGCKSTNEDEEIIMSRD